MWTTYPPQSLYDLPWGSYGSSRVVVGTTTEDARDVIRIVDRIAAYFLITGAALGLQASILEWADLFGIRDEIEYVVYGLRIASGVSGAAIAAGSGAALSTGIASVGTLAAALPAVGAAVAIVLAVTGGDDEELQKRRLADAQAKINHLRDRLTLKAFAAEQREAAITARLYAQNSVTIALSGQGSSAELEKQAKTADRLALLYDKAAKELPADQRALFESMSNLARWRAILDSYSQLSQKEQDNFNQIGFGKYEESLPWQLKPKIATEEKKLAALAEGASSPPGGALLLTLAAIAGVGAYAAIDPSGALANAKRALPFATGAVKTGARAASSAGSFVWRHIPKGK